MNKIRLQICCIYQPPTTSIPVFVNEFESFIEMCHDTSIPFVICGDFNIQLNQQNTATQRFQDLLESWALIQHVDFPTHIQGNILDFVITQSEQNLVSSVKSCGILSDHFCISAFLNFDTIVSAKHQQIKIRKIHKINSSSLRQDLLNSSLITNPASSASEGQGQSKRSMESCEQNPP